MLVETMLTEEEKRSLGLEEMLEEEKIRAEYFEGMLKM